MRNHLRRWLSCAVVLWLVAGTWAAAQQPPTAARSARRTKAPATLPPVADVNLEALRPSAAEPPKVTRNPFRFYQPPPPPASPSKVVKAPEPAFVAPPVPAGPPPPPPITLRFIGLIEAPQRSGRVALLSDGMMGPGPTHFEWDVRAGASPGLYFIAVDAGGARVAKRLAVTR